MTVSIPQPDWRDGRRYDILANCDRAGIAWEFLRRDPAYRPPLVRLGAVSATTGGSVEILAPDFPGAGSWGLSFR